MPNGPSLKIKIKVKSRTSAEYISTAEFYIYFLTVEHLKFPSLKMCVLLKSVHAQKRYNKNSKSDTFSICACHPCAGAMLIFSVSFQF